MMDNAKNHIHIYTLLLRANGKTGPETVAKMIAKSILDNCEVNFIYFPIAQIGYSSPAVIVAMNCMNVNTRGWWPRNISLTDINRTLIQGCHKKILLCDDPKYGLVSMIGGRNIGDEYLMDIPDPQPGRFPNQWRDTDVVIYGPANYDVEENYITSFNSQSGKTQKKLNPADGKYNPDVSTPDPKANVELRILENEPTMGKGIYQINDYYLALINNARYTIDIETPYFIPTDKFITALENAAKRGVKVRLLTNSENTNDMGSFLVYAGAYCWERLLKLDNFKIYLWDVERSVMDPSLFRTLHSKVIVVDSCVYFPSSWNFENTSMTHSSEIGCPITDLEMASVGQAMFNTDLSTPGVYEMTLSQYQKKFTAWDKVLMKLLRSAMVNNILVV
jgi:cardiolipin synthase